VPRRVANALYRSRTAILGDEAGGIRYFAAGR